MKCAEKLKSAKKEIWQQQGIYKPEGENVESAEFEEFINTVRENSDIYEVVSRYVPLVMKGGRFWACCPFHEEKTPSFSVSPDKGIFYCFGCHEGGNVFKFISKMEHISYFDAVKLQAERLGIKIPSRKKSSAEIQTEQEKDFLLKITSAARDFYHNCLKTQEGEKGRKYLEARGITKKVIEDFKLGYAPDSWDFLTKKITARGFTEKQLLAAGLAIEKKSGDGIYDRMRGRVIIPISDISGKAVAFGGRILVEDENQPKYLNTPETEIFSKGKLLFGLDKSKQAIISKNTAIVVEGYMDAISLFSAGVENVVASLGTAFTAEQAKLLSRYARKIIFCYDSDAAGQNATVRALPIMKNTGAEVFILVIPDGKDPDEFIRKHGKDAFEQLLKNVTPVIDYQFRYKLEHSDISTLGGKIKVLREIFPVCSELKNTVIQKEYLKKFSSALLIDEDLIFEEWRKFLSRSQKNKAAPKKNPVAEDSLIRRCGSSIIRKLWHDPEFCSYVFECVPKENFISIHIEILNYIEKCCNEEKMPNDLTAAENLSENANVEVAEILGTYLPQDSETKAFEDSIKILQRMLLKKKYKQELTEAENFFKAGDIKSYTEKMQVALNIKKEISEL